jgi:hypothetical protein
MAQSNHNIGIAITGDSSGLQKATKGSAVALQQLSQAIQTVSASTVQWNAATNRFQDAQGRMVGVVGQARAAVALLTAERQRAIQVENALIASLSAEEIAILRNAGAMTSLTVATERSSAAKIKNAQANQASANSMGAASFALTSLGQTFADAGQFGMGLAQGIRAVTNNVQQFAFAFVFLRIQLGTTALAAKALWSALAGPLGILFAFQFITGAMEGLSNFLQKSNSEAKKAKEAFGELYEVMKGGNKITLSSVEQVDNLIKAYGSVVPQAVGRSKEDIEKLTEVLKGLRSELVLNNALYDEQIAALGIDGMLLADIVASNEDLLRTYKELSAERSKERSDATDRNTLLTTQVDLLKKLQEAEADLFINRLKNVGDPGDTIGDLERKVKLTEDAATAGFSSIEAFATEYELFKQKLRRIGSDADVTQSQFAKLLADGKEEAFLREELAKADKRFGDEALARIRLTIKEMERLNKESEKFAKLGTLRSPLDGLPGTATSIGKARDIIDGGVVTDDGRLRSEALADMQIGSEMLRQLPEDATIAAQHAADGIASVSQTFGESVQGWLTTNNEAIQKNAQMLGSSLGSAGQAFSQLAQMGGEANESLFNTGKAFAIGSAIVNTAAAITKALAEGGPFLGPAMAATMAASGAAQIAVIARTKFGDKSGSVSTPSGSASFSPPNTFSNFTSLAQITAQGAGPSFAGGGSSASNNMQFRFVMRGDELIGVMDNTIAKGDAIVGRGTIGTSNRSSFVYSDVLDGIYRDGKGV